MLKPLTSLRFFAALLVFARHCPLTMFAAIRYWTGNAGVEFFFVLSGFILIYAHRELFKDRLAWVRVKDFWAARFARIYPVHMLAFALALFMVFRSHGVNWIGLNVGENIAALFTQLTLTQSWLPLESLFNFNGVAWSVSDEVFFYMLFPALAVCLSLAVTRAGRSTALGVASLLWLINVALAGWNPGEFFLYNFPPTRFLDFAIGACLGAVFCCRKAPGASANMSATAMEMTALGLGVAAIFLTPAVPEPFRYSAWLAPFSALVIYVFACGEGHVSKVLNSLVIVYLGEISYNFYMLHALVLTLIYSQLKASAPAAVSVLSLLLCLSISTVVYERFEMPLRKRIRGFFTEPAPVPAVA